MANEFCDIFIDEKPLEIAPAAFQAGAGAVVEFWGVVRGSENGNAIAGIFYEAHEDMAMHQLRRIAEAALEKFGCEKIMLHHRIGFVPVAEPSLFVRVTAKHRGAAFEGCEWIIEQLKQLVPIWKNPRFLSEPETAAAMPNEGMTR